MRAGLLRPGTGRGPDRGRSFVRSVVTYVPRTNTLRATRSISNCPNRHRPRRFFGARNLFRFNAACDRAAEDWHARLPSSRGEAE